MVKYSQQAPDLPDSIFPNNWFSTHRNADIPGKHPLYRHILTKSIIDGLFVLYPMKAPTREREKNALIINEVGKKNYKHMIDLQRQKPNQALEGTGSLLFDVDNHKIYCNLSVRADKNLLAEFVTQYNKVSKQPYRSVVWKSVDPKHNPVYHTNVVMALLKDHAILCTESIPDVNERKKVVAELTDPKLNEKPKKLIDIGYKEMLNMAGNMIMVNNKHGDHCVIMSERARKNLKPDNL